MTEQFTACTELSAVHTKIESPGAAAPFHTEHQDELIGGYAQPIPNETGKDCRCPSGHRAMRSCMLDENGMINRFCSLYLLGGNS